MLNVRLPKDLEKKLKQYSEQADVPKSFVVKEALTQYFSRKEQVSSPFAVGADLFGLEGSGDAHGSTQYKAKLKQKLSEKHAH